MRGYRLLIAGVGLACALVARADVSGQWVLDVSLSDDVVRVMRDGGRKGDGAGRQVLRGANIFGIPVGSLPPRGSGSSVDEEPFPGVEQVTDGVQRLSIEVGDEVTALTYDRTRIEYHPEQREGRGVTSVAHWRDGVLEIEHELANGARVTERYAYESRKAELHWTAHFKPRKGAAFEVERLFYKAPSR